MKIYLGLVLAVMSLLSGCAGTGTMRYETVAAKESFEVRDISFDVEGAGWFRAPNPEYNHIRLVRTASPAVSIEVNSRWALVGENTYKRRWQDMMPREQGEFFLFRKQMTIEKMGGVVTESNLESTTWAGKPAFKLTARYTTALGLDMELVAYGTDYDRFFYVIAYEADRVEDFEKFRSLFERVAKTARLPKG